LPMTKLATLSLCLGLALVFARPAAAQRTDAATMQDIQRLQYDLQNLDDSLAALSTSHPRYQEFQDRANDIRDDVTYLKVQIRRGQRSRPPGLGATQGEVADLRRSIATLQDDIDGGLNRRFSGSGSLPEGTEIQVRLEQPLSSKTARQEDRFDASVAVPVELDGRVVLPAWSAGSGCRRGGGSISRSTPSTSTTARAGTCAPASSRSRRTSTSTVTTPSGRGSGPCSGA